MDAPFSSPSSDLDRRVIAGWAAIEHGDIGEARAALSDVYAVDPAHPALPLLAASIRRTRPKRITWRSAVLLLLIVAGAAYLVQSMRTRAVQEASLSSAASADEVPAEPPSLTPPSTGTASVGTSGQKRRAQIDGQSGNSRGRTRSCERRRNHSTRNRALLDVVQSLDTFGVRLLRYLAQRRIRDGDMSRARHTAIDRDRERWNLDVLVQKNRRRLEDRQHPAAARFTARSPSTSVRESRAFTPGRRDRPKVVPTGDCEHVHRRLGKTPDSADRVNCSKRFGCLLLL